MDHLLHYHPPFSTPSSRKQSPALLLLLLTRRSLLLQRTASATPTDSTSDLASLGGDGTPVRSTWEQRLWVASASSSLLTLLSKSAPAFVDSSHGPLTPCAVAAIAAYLLADLATGIYHWAVDNYGDSSTPIMGAQCNAFQGHHRSPWVITTREFANNMHASARPASIALLPFHLLPIGHASTYAFVAVFMGCIVFSQQFHAWAHTKKRHLPALVVILQSLHLLVPRRMHAAHHRRPYDTNYCIVSGMWNPVLDELGFFRRMESFIFFAWGVRPRCWEEGANGRKKEENGGEEGDKKGYC